MKKNRVFAICDKELVMMMMVMSLPHAATREVRSWTPEFVLGVFQMFQVEIGFNCFSLSLQCVPLFFHGFHWLFLMFNMFMDFHGIHWIIWIVFFGLS